MAVAFTPVEEGAPSPKAVRFRPLVRFKPLAGDAPPIEEGAPALAQFIVQEPQRLDTSPLLPQARQLPEGVITPQLPGEGAPSEAEQAAVLSQDDQFLPIGGRPAEMPRFGAEGTMTRGASEAISGLAEWAINNPEEALLSFTPVGPAIAARYAPEIATQFGKDLAAGFKGDKQAMGRALTVGLMVLGPKAFAKGKEAIGAAKAAYLTEGPPKRALPDTDVEAREALRPKATEAREESSFAEPPSPLEVPVEHEVVLPQATEAFKAIAGEAKEVSKDASENSQAKEVYGDVLRDAQEGQSAKAVPVDEGSPGVRAQEALSSAGEARQPGLSSEEIIGMGGAVPGEFKPLPQTTGIKNAKIDEQREARGLEPLTPRLRQTWGEAWERAMARIDEDPQWQDRLATDLAKRPRPASDVETAALLQRMTDLRNELDKARRAERQAWDDGRVEDAAAHKALGDEWSQKLANLEETVRDSATEKGKALASQKMLMNDDFTLAKMEMELRSAKGGGHLTHEEKATLTRLQKEVADTQARLDVKERELTRLRGEKAAAGAKSEAASAAREFKVRPDGTAAIPTHIQRIVGKVGEVLDRRADAARVRLRGKVFTISPEVLKDLAEVGAANIYHIGMDFAKWSARMVEELGERVRPHLDEVWKAAQKLIDETAVEVAGAKPRAKRAARAVAETARSPEERRLATWKKRTVDAIVNVEARTARGDTTPLRQAREPIRLDHEGLELAFQLKKAKERWHELVMKESLQREELAKRALRKTFEGSAVIRGWLTSLDLSAVLRQGKFAVLQHPIIAARAFVPMLKAFASEKAAFAVEHDLATRENTQRYARAGLALTDLHSPTLAKMEEAYMGRWLHKIPGVGSSARAYTVFLNRLRADTFDALVKTLGEGTPGGDRVIANAVNVFTGRGSLPFQEQAAGALNSIFFAPRFVASRFQTALGQPLYHGLASRKVGFKGTAQARAIVAGEYARLLAGYAVIYALAQAAGAEVSWDPRSTDFGKIRLGKTRVDPLAGLSQITTLVARLASGEKMSQKGRVTPLRGKVPYGASDAADVIGSFLRQKLAPVPQLFFDVTTGQFVTSEKVTPESLAVHYTIPISFQDVADTMKEQGVPLGTALLVLSVLGEGISTYEERPHKR